MNRAATTNQNLLVRVTDVFLQLTEQPHFPNWKKNVRSAKIPQSWPIISVLTYTCICMYNIHAWMHTRMNDPHFHMHTGTLLVLCFPERSTVQRLEHDWVPGWCHAGETHACCGETFSVQRSRHFRADPSPHHHRLLISCSGPSWEPRETSKQMEFHLVTLPTARSGYMAKGSGAELLKLTGVLFTCQDIDWARLVCSFLS